MIRVIFLIVSALALIVYAESALAPKEPSAGCRHTPHHTLCWTEHVDLDEQPDD